jgi:hypothetical protein
LLLSATTISGVIAGLDPAIHSFRKKMDRRVSALRTGPVMTTE